MAKKTSETTTTKAAAAEPQPTKPTIEFGAWLQTARARGEAVGELITTLKADKKITDESKLVNVKKRYGDRTGFDVIEARYALFCKRGSQAGKRTRKTA